MIVTTEDNTEITVTLTQDITNIDGNDNIIDGQNTQIWSGISKGTDADSLPGYSDDDFDGLMI